MEWIHNFYKLFCWVSCDFLLSLYLQYFHGLNPWKTGMILAIQPILIALVSPVAGKLSDKKNPKGVAATGIIIIIWAMIIFSFLGSLYLIVLELVFMGLGFAFFFHPE
ncbi:MAG: MFS transporter [Methanobacteriaceae archaeon]|nr:MFS transporter [Methanobacteriaceae archaeon]